MDFKRHWKIKDNTHILSLGNGLITARVFYTGLIPRNDKNVYQALLNDVSIGRYEKENEAIKAIEQNITTRIIKILNQVGYGVK